MDTIQALPSRRDAIRSFQEGGGLIAAVFPIHYPRALFRAFNLLPVEVWGPPGVDSGHGAAHLQPYVCSIVRNALSFLQAGGLEVADFLVVPHTCDSLQGFGSILIDFVSPRQPVLPIYLPRGKRPSDVDFFANELQQLSVRLAAIIGRSPSDEELLRNIEREETADTLLAKLHRQRRKLDVTDLEFYRLIRSREYLPAERFSDLAEKVFHEADGELRVGTPLLLSGIVPEPMSLLGTISELGGMVVADDLASCGRRLYPTGLSEDPYRRMAERILYAPPDPTRGSPIQERKRHLIQLAERAEARGIVFYDVKFCEPELFDIPILRRSLQEAGYPSIAIEVDISDPLSHQVQARLGSFVEMIE